MKGPPSAPGGGVPKGKAHFYALWERGPKPDNDDYVGKL